ncbi:hypothetical protein L6164_022867 [Bauhinia variegata]|uniref:Uncharacterized protein n=1 Tax=Bauhinia variegata TaxID=167791 RepID=A0ACB9MHT5_BAUVA|nr:hypothetical protein L6164_022867 [Bauhinia variegata]
MESSSNDNKKPELGFHAYQTREAGSTSGETSLHLIGLFPYVNRDDEKKKSNPEGNWTCLKCCNDEVFKPKTDLVSEGKKLDD